MSLIISHGDGDGICAATIAFKTKPSKIVFAQPPSLPRLLGKIVLQINQIKELTVIDIAVDERQVDRLLMNLKLLRDKNINITFIDHHPSSKTILQNFRNLGVLPIINTNFSASQLTYRHFGTMNKVAIIGGMCDRVIDESSDLKLAEEAEILTGALKYKPADNEFKLFVVKELVKGKLPSDIQECMLRSQLAYEPKKKAVEIALDSIIEETPRFVIMQTKEDILGHAGGAVNAVAEQKGKIAVMIFEANTPELRVTFRKPHRLLTHLGEMAKEAAAAVGGIGGGHAGAAMARIPKTQISKFIKLLLKRGQHSHNRSAIKKRRKLSRTI